jgi:CheY-like chemotaxis protein
VDFILRDTVAEILKSLGLRAHLKELELACHVLPDVPDHLVGDPMRIRQILTNLVGNAIKFTDHGEVIVTVGMSPEGGAQPNHDASSPSCLLVFEVRDTGIGIAPDKLTSIFRPFEQADSSTTRKYGGTGLGLTITSRLIEMMGGRIWVTSVPGQGSTFHFTARFGISANPPPKRAVQPVPVHDLPVLVVDDNATNRRILDELLQSWDMRPSLASQADEALVELERAAAGGKPYPLVLLDARMPDVDGFALAEEIRRRPHLARATIMMLSSAHRPGDGARCRALHLAGRLTKPVNPSELLEAILHALAIPSPGEPAPMAPPPTGPSSPAQAPDGAVKLRVLLAEDNPVNQKLALRLLEKQGHTVRVVDTGTAAVRAVQTERFDLVLMDVQMPDMGGLEATAALRAWERGDPARGHVQIVAMTAHAMKGDREQCLAAGMDGYLSKPIQARKLFEILNNVHGPENQNGLDIDRDDLLARVQGDHELLRDVVRLFHGSVPGLLERAWQALRTGQKEPLQRAVHSLKGSVSNFSSPLAMHAAERLEALVNEGRLAEAESALREMESAVTKLLAALDHWLAEPAGCGP